MEPLAIVGAVAAIGQLSELCIKAGNASTQHIQSFINAPRELKNLSAKLTRLQIIIEQFQALSNDLSNANADDLLPATHKDMLHSCLLASESALRKLTTLYNSGTADPRSRAGNSFQQRLRWSFIDKKEAKSVLEELKGAEIVLDTVIVLLGARLSSQTRTSTSAMQLAQQAFHAELMEPVQEVKNILQTQVLTASEFTAQANHTLFSILQLQTESNMRIQDLNSSHEQLSSELSKLRYDISNDVPRSTRSMPPGRLNISRQEPNSPLPKTPTIHTSLPPSKSQRTNTEEVLLKVDQLMAEYDWKKFLARHVLSIGPDDQLFSITAMKSSVGGAVTVLSKRNEWRLHAKLRARLRILGQRIFQLEVQARQFASTWMSLPRMGCSMTVVNIRPASAPIFQACFDWDLVTVKQLLESGEASVNDVDDETRRGLLEHLFRTHEYNSDKALHLSSTTFRGQALLRYLLCRGCNPNAFNGTTDLPAVLFAFRYGFTSSVSSLLCYGADLESFQVSPADILESDAHQTYKWQLKLLHSLGFSDWNPARNASSSLLHAAARYNDIPGLLFGLEAIGIDPNTGDNYKTALHKASMSGNIFVGSILREAGANINPGHGTWGGTPLHLCMDWMSFEMGHWLLQCGAATDLLNSLSNDVWCNFWQSRMEQVDWDKRQRFDFVREEAMLTHLLLHDSNPHQLFSTVWSRDFDHSFGFFREWYDYCGYIKTREIARASSYRITGLWDYSVSNENGNDCYGFPEEIKRQYENAEHARTPAGIYLWCNMGHIFLAESDTSEDSESIIHGEAGGEDVDNYSDGVLEFSDGDIDSDSEGSDRDCRDDSSDGSDDENDSDVCDRDTDEGVKQSSRLGNTTLFYDTISTPEGRRHMSRFPFVCLLTNALCLAGYRAETDDDGDVWYDDEDGDRYHDAREFQPHEDEDDGLVRNCPMCQNPEKYGLGHIVEEAERGKQLLLEYRARAKPQKRRYF